MASRVHDLIARCPPLDRNSLYCNLLQCSHFRNTCAIALDDDDVVGFMSGYVPPREQDRLFVWQIAVAPEARGQGLAKTLVRDVLRRPECRELRYLITTITARNAASWAMFHGLAAEFGAAVSERPLFDENDHFDGRHETEYELTIGPFEPISQSPENSEDL